jgi:hypothetical protein
MGKRKLRAGVRTAPRKTVQTQRSPRRLIRLFDPATGLDSKTDHFDQHADELLKIGGMKNDHKVRSDLVIALQLAHVTYEGDRKLQRHVPLELIEQFEASVRKTLGLLRSLEGYPYCRDVGNVMHPVGRGVIDVAKVQDMKFGQTLSLPRRAAISDADLLLPSLQPDEMMAAVNVKVLLRAIVLKVTRGKRRRGQPKNMGTRAILWYAAQFFLKHSGTRPSTDNRFHEFAMQFYKLVTGDDPDQLEWQIRSVLKELRARD